MGPTTKALPTSDDLPSQTENIMSKELTSTYASAHDRFAVEDGPTISIDWSPEEERRLVRK